MIVMVSSNLTMDAVDFRYLLLENYKRLGISEKQVIVLLMVDHLLRSGNSFVTGDLLALKMNYKVEECDSSLAEFLKDGFLSYETKEGKMRTSLEPLKKKLYAQFQNDLSRQKASLSSPVRTEMLSRLYSYFERRLNRTLSPLETDTIDGWLDDAYSEGQIKDALENAIAAGKKTMKSVDRELRTARKRGDIEKEGYSGVSDYWDKDIEKTIELAKQKWKEDEGK